MTYFIDKISRNEDVLQGDVFKVVNSDNELFTQDETLALIITADCDIANNKMGNYYSVLPIISAEKYLAHYWVAGFFSKEYKKILDSLLLQLNKSGEICEGKYDPLTDETLDQWLNEESLINIVESLNLRDNFKSLEEVDEKLGIIKNVKDINCFIKYKRFCGSKDKTILKDIASALKSCGEQYYFLPQIDLNNSFGSIIKLREIRPVHKKQLFLDETSERLSSSPTNNVIRIGRLSDYLRYSISQCFALLFSRIGLPTEFEKDKNDSIEVISQNIMEKYNDV